MILVRVRTYADCSRISKSLELIFRENIRYFDYSVTAH